ncbi:restriction endonuclease subunit S [Francisella tularensis subsp. novicida]|uniref:Restriction endonuclease subunit S n=2 Tax=Francisella tularensis TaxID=263 RepID=A0A6I4RVU6_FRATU|nr:restriction endonuclease subunit S [Francisella tularensis]ABK89599.1 type I restriction-modification system, subunit S [Francisella tularensis subsp. novicida U112]AJI61187.1 type I restriction modification DNA specificity domain protein [Francisella tularensis subsp. novicida U112]EDX19943.1 type I restriction modification DNA specificity domain protein [Francisella tularensis subsp. novicida FTE]MBK2036628.1 restriction endonuclease subunit S [Francisella tularensis subsp. novicida]MBK21
MNKDAESKKVPKLRFKEFSGEWEENNIKALTSLLKDGSHGTHKEASESDYLLLSAKNITNGSINVYEDDRRISEEDYRQIYRNYHLQKDDLVLTIVGTIGRSALVKEIDKIAFQRSVAFFRFKNHNSKFVYQLFNTPKFLNELDRRKVVSAQPGIYLGDLAKIKLTLPSKQEQQKIADCLSTWDDSIENLKSLIENKKLYKKGMMQKLFSQEIRFKADNGSDFPEWVEKRLGDVGTVITGKTPSTSNTELWNGNIEFITPTDIEGAKYQTRTSRTVTEQTKMNILPIGTIVYTCIGSIGKMSLSTLPSITNQQINSLIVNEQNNNEFVYYSLLNLTPYIQSTQANTTLPIINKTEFSKFKIKVPCLAEQTKIANFLSCLDDEIELLEQELEQLQLQKKGLMQGMFV